MFAVSRSFRDIEAGSSIIGKDVFDVVGIGTEGETEYSSALSQSRQDCLATKCSPLCRAVDFRAMDCGTYPLQRRMSAHETVV